MYHPRLSGTYYEMGRRYGLSLSRHGFQVPSAARQPSEFVRKSENALRNAFPEIDEEIQGVADGCRVPYEAMAAFLLTVGIEAPSACSEFATYDGSRVVFGRNYDFYYRFAKYVNGYFTSPKGGYRSIAHSDIFVGREDGINERGLAVAISFVAPTVVEPGVNFPFAVRCVLDTCRDVDEAAKRLTAMRISTTNNYLLADPSGDIAVVQVSPGKTRIRRPDAGDGFLIATNHFVDPEMQDREAPEKRDPDSVQRYLAISERIRDRDGVVGPAEAQRILSDHAGAVCSHHDDQQLGTLWSVVADLGKLQVFRAEGHPCSVQYKPDVRLRRALSRSSTSASTHEGRGRNRFPGQSSRR